jgi:hypothetical protein
LAVAIGPDLAYHEERYRERVLRQLSQRANKLGMQLVAAPQAAWKTPCVSVT